MAKARRSTKSKRVAKRTDAQAERMLVLGNIKGINIRPGANVRPGINVRPSADVQPGIK